MPQKLQKWPTDATRTLAQRSQKPAHTETIPFRRNWFTTDHDRITTRNGEPIRRSGPPAGQIFETRHVFGLGRSRAIEILEKAQVSQDKKVQDWNDDEIGAIREAVSTFKIEGELRSEVSLNIKRLMDIGCYRGIRHRSGLPLRGQRTKNNSRTRKGKRKTVANKKKATK